MEFKIKELMKEVNELANKNGFWNEYNLINDLNISMNQKVYYLMDERQEKLLLNSVISQKLMLIVSELGEAMEVLRKNGLKINNNEFEKDSISDELADSVIRIFDLAEQFGIDLEQCIKWKHEYNKNRPYKHGKSF